ncbi:MAG: DMT family transporter [Proteobacteria bacterium]|nr:DMT family transporter [Pseudomonadota bacterium]
MWLPFAFLSALLLGFYDISKKRSLKENAVVPVLFLNTLFSSLLFVPFLAGSGTGLLPPDHLLYVPQTHASEQGYIFIKSALVLSSWFFGYIGIKHLPLTLVGPINATRPVLVLLGAVLIFGERLNLWQWAGVLTAIFAFYLLSRSGKKEGIDFKHNQWVGAIVLACILGAACGLYDKYLMASPASGGLGLDRMVVQTYYNFYQCALMGVMMLAMWLPHRKSQPFHWIWAIPCISLFLSAADFVYLYALSLDGAMIAIVSMVRRASVLVSFTFAALVLREKNLRDKAIDLGLVLASMIFLCIGSLWG